MPPEEPVSDVPEAITDEIIRMRQQGLSNNQIVTMLQRAGYKPHQIFDAMSYADMKTTGGTTDQDAMNAPQNYAPDTAPDMPPANVSMGQQSYPGPAPQEYAQESTYAYTQDVVEELVEAVVEEKWAELVKSVNKIIAWKNGVESRLAVLEQRLEDLKHQFEQLNKGVLEKITEYDQNITNVGTEIKAMERVFQKVLPTFTDNVNELSRISKNLRQASPVKKE